MDCPVKITWKWGITLAPGFICWKIIFDLEIFGGHFVFALKKFRPRVPKWHPADSCSGHPLETESIIKHRPYRETRLSKKMSFDNWTISVLGQGTISAAYILTFITRLWFKWLPGTREMAMCMISSMRRNGCRSVPGCPWGWNGILIIWFSGKGVNVKIIELLFFR